MRHAAELAALGSCSELWVQHSDRLARGDGKTARHVVELALWANKSDVSIRSLQDPDTFRDLLYAVVSGQRNHLDSQRKGESVAAGLRRAVARGVYAGISLDGYRVAVTVGPDNSVTKRLEIDPERAPLIRTIFAMALEGQTPWEIAEAVTADGWRTVGGRNAAKPGRYEAWGILRVLNNPRYAGLSPWKGEILARAQWPAYITPEQFSSLRPRRKRIRSIGPRPRQPFLLVGVARCADCLSTIRAITGVPRQDGSQMRSYMCSGHAHKHCEAKRTDAVAADSVFIQHLAEFVSDRARTGPPGGAAPARNGDARAGELKRRITHALAADDLAGAGALFDELRTGAQATDVVALSDKERPAMADEGPFRSSVLAGFHAWAASAIDHPQKVPVTETERLRKILKVWFDRVELRATESGLEMTPIPKGQANARPIRVDYGRWRLEMTAAGYPRRLRTAWTEAEIINALHRWVEQHGEPPASTDWIRASRSHPMATNVFSLFGSWRAALEAAGYSESRPRRRGPAKQRDDSGRFVTVR
jgi:Recombinase/Homing endonuclease associated repeat